jgi:hypothetical protein
VVLPQTNKPTDQQTDQQTVRGEGYIDYTYQGQTTRLITYLSATCV